MEKMEGKGKLGNPYDINGQYFNPDMFLQKLLKENDLREVIDKEDIIVKDTQSLHSDMQTLVYENYNKFISATDTIRKMKTDFKQMEAEMDSLGKNMDSITLFSGQISNTLHDTRQQIAKLSATHSLLERLQFLFKLPNKLKILIEEGSYSQAVQDYMQTRHVLDHYAHLESFSGIRTDCLSIIDQLKEKLHEQFKSKEATPKELTESVELLLKLDEPVQSLYSQYLEHAASRLHDNIFILESENTGDDLVDFVNIANKGFLCELCLVVTSYKNVFISTPADGTSHEDAEDAGRRLSEFIFEQMEKFLECIRARVFIELERSDIPILVQSLDIFYSKLCSVTTLFNDNQFAMRGIQLIIEVGEKQAVSQRETLEEKLNELIRGVRQSVAQGQTDISELSTNLVLNIVESVKGVLGHFTLFIQPELSFAIDKNFIAKFSANSMRNTLVINFIHYINKTVMGFTKNQTPSLSTLLILASVCLEFSSTHINYLLCLVDEWFNTKPTAQTNTQKEELCKEMQTDAQELINHYVKVQGNIISRMVRKSIETRDWATGSEPRTVRPVMKRVMEELASSDSAVGSLFEEGVQPTEPGSGSRHHHHRSVGPSVWSPSTGHSYTHNLNKIFSDKIEIFSPVELTKVSVLTGVIKIGLKTFLECVRLKTFSKYGLQQIQIDVHYLQLYLWRYVSDEKIVHLLLDEILSSAINRCTNPVLMEPSVVEIICERG
ncbi:vacuolar protein sorting-associated protein 51 homolog [Cimex lectularius]|uniref:Vacuolar protein sorting-associated protein 51 homolog n=1 Tax=Cimex lectularius TaxID=79782 RepID=A0A8I6S536_CIMLE|nr:vacuolar protein sorting-associated protein 51 homolog [Cimex lectularius]